MITKNQFQFNRGPSSEKWYTYWFEENCDESATKILDYLKIKGQVSYDIVMDKLEDDKIQRKIIRNISNYKLIPNDLVEDYLRHIKRDVVQDQLKKPPHQRSHNYRDARILDALNFFGEIEVKEAIMSFILERYNSRSLLDFDLFNIVLGGWDNNALMDTDPREVIWEYLDQIALEKVHDGSYLIGK